MQVVGRKSMRCALAALGLLMASLAIVSPKGFLVAAESAEDVAVGSTVTQEKLEAARAAVIAEEEEDEPTIPGGEVQVLTEENFERLTQVATGATTGDWFIEFYAPWCGHCKKLAPVWNELAATLGGEVNVGKVDVTTNRGLGKRFGIKGFPTLLFFSHGTVRKYAGSRKLEALLPYAQGGFKSTESAPVPEPPSLVGNLKSVLEGVLKDVEGLKNGKMPTQATIAILTAALLLLMVMFALLLPSKPRPAKRD